MALWMQAAPGDRKSDVQEQLRPGGVDPWQLQTSEEQVAAMATLAHRRRWTETARETPQASDFTDVRLSRGMCFGECPVYRVTLSTDGLVDYEGEVYVERLGQHHGEIEPDRVTDLVRAILLLGLAGSDPEDLPPLTDQPATEVQLVSEQRSIRFSDDDASPLVWAMAALVEAVVDEVEWHEEPDDDEEGVQLRTSDGPHH